MGNELKVKAVTYTFNYTLQWKL